MVTDGVIETMNDVEDVSGYEHTLLLRADGLYPVAVVYGRFVQLTSYGPAYNIRPDEVIARGPATILRLGKW